MADPLGQVARCLTCSWEVRGRHAYRDAQLHLEENPDHQAYSNAGPAPRAEKDVPVCRECGNDLGPYGGLCLDCLEAGAS